MHVKSKQHAVQPQKNLVGENPVELKPSQKEKDIEEFGYMAPIHLTLLWL